MSQAQYKKKMTFDEYENKLSVRSNLNKQFKRNISQTHKLSDKPNKISDKPNKLSDNPQKLSDNPHKLSDKANKTFNTTKQEYAQKPFMSINGRSLNSTSLNQVNTTNQSNMSIINQSSFTSNPASPSPNTFSSSHTNASNINVTPTDTIAPPVLHTNPQPSSHLSVRSQQVSKIDLIFEKQPQDVQMKLRMLLLNYNAVMQYNQDEDKFQVDLLLPFNTPEQKQFFVDKFVKTRHYVSQQIQCSHNQHQTHLQQQHQQHHQQQHHHSQHQPTNYQPRQHLPQNIHEARHQNKPSQFHPNLHTNISQDHPHHSTKRSPNQSYQEGDNVLSTSLRQQAQRIQQEKQLQQTDHIIDFFALSQSLDLSIQKGLTRVKLSKINTNQTQNQTQNHQLKPQQIDQPSKAQLQHQEPHQHINKTQQSPPTHTQNQYKQPSSQIQSQISEGLKPNIPHSIQRNLMHTPSGKKAPPESAWMKPLQQNPSESLLANSSLDYSHDDNSRMIKPTGHSIYESPIAPLKLNQSHDRNNTSNQILIQDIQSYDDMEIYQTPSKRQRLDQFQMEQESYDSAYGMIEETAEEHEDQHFPSSQEYKEFLKKKISDTNSKSISKQKPPSRHSSSFPSKQHSSRHSSSFPSKQHSSRHSSNFPSKQHSIIGHPRQSSSLRAKYSQFLSKNHKKIESLYLRIGREMKKKNQQQQKKQQQQSQQQHLSHKRKQRGGQILVADDESEETNQKEEGLLEGYKKRIVMENESMSSEDKVRYFRYLARHAKGLYIDFIRGHNNSKRSHN